jgi:hypothetical protein
MSSEQSPLLVRTDSGSLRGANSGDHEYHDNQNAIGVVAAQLRGVPGMFFLAFVVLIGLALASQSVTASQGMKHPPRLRGRKFDRESASWFGRAPEHSIPVSAAPTFAPTLTSTDIPIKDPVTRVIDKQGEASGVSSAPTQSPSLETPSVDEFDSLSQLSWGEELDYDGEKAKDFRGIPPESNSTIRASRTDPYIKSDFEDSLAVPITDDDDMDVTFEANQHTNVSTASNSITTNILETVSPSAEEAISQQPISQQSLQRTPAVDSSQELSLEEPDDLAGNQTASVATDLGDETAQKTENSSTRTIPSNSDDVLESIAARNENLITTDSPSNLGEEDGVSAEKPALVDESEDNEAMSDGCVEDGIMSTCLISSPNTDHCLAGLLVDEKAFFFPMNMANVNRLLKSRRDGKKRTRNHFDATQMEPWALSWDKRSSKDLAAVGEYYRVKGEWLEKSYRQLSKRKLSKKHKSRHSRNGFGALTMDWEADEERVHQLSQVFLNIALTIDTHYRTSLSKGGLSTWVEDKRGVKGLRRYLKELARLVEDHCIDKHSMTEPKLASSGKEKVLEEYTESQRVQVSQYYEKKAQNIDFFLEYSLVEDGKSASWKDHIAKDLESLKDETFRGLGDELDVLKLEKMRVKKGKLVLNYYRALYDPLYKREFKSQLPDHHPDKDFPQWGHDWRADRAHGIAIGKYWAQYNKITSKFYAKHGEKLRKAEESRYKHYFH